MIRWGGPAGMLGGLLGLAAAGLAVAGPSATPAALGLLALSAGLLAWCYLVATSADSDGTGTLRRLGAWLLVGGMVGYAVIFAVIAAAQAIGIESAGGGLRVASTVGALLIAFITAVAVPVGLGLTGYRLMRARRLVWWARATPLVAAGGHVAGAITLVTAAEPTLWPGLSALVSIHAVGALVLGYGLRASTEGADKAP